MTVTRTLSLAGAVLVLALGAGACGEDEDQAPAAALAATQAFERALVGDQPRRACELMTTRARAQLAAAADASGCAQALAGRGLDFERHSAAEFANASTSMRGDRVIIVLGGLGDRVGLRRVRGEWLVDNIVNVLEERPTAADPGLSKGSDVQQVQATVNAQSAALSRRDYERACALYSHGAEAQIVIGLAFNLLFADKQIPTRLTCASALRRLVTLTHEEDPFAGQGQPVGQVDAAQVSIRGAHATVDVAGYTARQLIRQDGRWVVDAGLSSYSADEHIAGSELKRCWQRSGARIASDAGELRFATERTVRDVSDNGDHVSIKGDDWRVFYARPTDGRRLLYARRALGKDPGLAKVLARPAAVPVVAYVKDAPAHPDIVAKVRRCGDAVA